MGEIKRKLKKLKEGKKYRAKADDYLIREHHSIADVIRFAIKQSGIEDVEYIVFDEKKKQSD